MSYFMTAHSDLWQSTLTDIELEVTPANFATWFKDTFIARQEEGVIYLSVPNQFVRDWVQNKYHPLVLRTLRKFSDSVRAVEYVVTKERPGDREEEQKPRSLVTELPLQDLYINKEDNLNPRYDFNAFVVGGFNELAFAAAQHIIKNPGKTYNPFFVYGRTGCGKTHLIQAVGNAIKKTHADRRVYYVTSETFAQDLVNALRTNRMNTFKERYRRYDVLIMDDIQFLSGKEKTQDELFHLFNALYEHNKQILFSCDQHPNYLQNLEERLKSRFSAGMIVDIGAPDKESRSAIVKAKASVIGIELPEDVVDYVATTIDGNVRELEGVLNTIVCHTQLKNKDVTLADVRRLLKNNIRPRRSVSIEEVVKRVARFYNLDEESIYKKSRKKEVVKPRQLIMYILREDFSIAYPTIGQKLGGRDHTTVIHSYEKIKRLSETNVTLAHEVQQIRALL